MRTCNRNDDVSARRPANGERPSIRFRAALNLYAVVRCVFGQRDRVLVRNQRARVGRVQGGRDLRRDVGLHLLELGALDDPKVLHAVRRAALEQQAGGPTLLKAADAPRQVVDEQYAALLPRALKQLPQQARACGGVRLRVRAPTSGRLSSYRSSSTAIRHSMLTMSLEDTRVLCPYTRVLWRH